MSTQPIREAIDLFDVTVAVERAMTFSERLNFYARQSGTGAPDSGRDGIADWISDAQDNDHAPSIVEPWWELYWRPAHDILRETGMPTELIQPLVSSALYASIGAGLVDNYRQGAYDVIDLARRAALWTCGGLEARGWTPGTATGKLMPPDPPTPVDYAPVPRQDVRQIEMRWEAPIPAMTTDAAASLMDRMAAGPLKLTMGTGGPRVGELHDVTMIDGILVGRGTVDAQGPLASLLDGLDNAMRCSIGFTAQVPRG